MIKTTKIVAFIIEICDIYSQYLTLKVFER